MFNRLCIHFFKNLFCFSILTAWMQQQQQQQQNYLQLPDVKQEPISPNYGDLASSNTPPPLQRFTPSPNIYNVNSFSPNIPIQARYDMGGYIPSVSPLQHANLLNQPYQSPSNQNQVNITNAMDNAAINFFNNNQNPNLNNQTEQRNLGDILANNLNNINCLNNIPTTNNDDNGMENVSMNISSLLDLDSQQHINTSELLSSDVFNDIMKNLDNGGNGANAIQNNNVEADEENMTDSFKAISIE